MSKRNRNHSHPAPDRERARIKAAILVSLSRGATRAAACEAAGVPRRTFYNWIDQHASFRNAVEDAELKPVALAEAVAFCCAMKAETDPRYLRDLFHFLKHRSGWGEKPRREAGPHEGRYDDTPDPDRDLTTALRAEIEAAGLPPWGGVESPEVEQHHATAPTEPDAPSTSYDSGDLEGLPDGLTDEEFDDWVIRKWSAAAEHAENPAPDVPPVPFSGTRSSAHSTRRATTPTPRPPSHAPGRRPDSRPDEDYFLLPGGIRVPVVPSAPPPATQ